MPRNFSYDDYDQAAAADRLLYRENSRITAGAAAFHQLDPSEIAMQIEEYSPREHAASERSALRNEIFCGFAEYLFAEGPAPQQVLARIEGFFESFHPDLYDAVTGPRTWCSEATTREVLQKYQHQLAAVAAASRSRGALSTWSASLASELDFEFVRETLVGLVKFMASEGLQRRNLVAVAYCIAKALRPSLIAGMSLHDIALLSGDEGGRATPCDRIRRLYNRRLAAAGNKACSVHFQKSAATVTKYAAAQLGNKNRTKSKRGRKKLPKQKNKKTT